MIIDHTDVSDALWGTGASKQLVAIAFNNAWEQDIKILTLCPFARSVFDKVKSIRYT